MKPGTEQRMIDELEQATAADVWPDYKGNDEWENLSRRIPGRRFAFPLWAAAASIAAVAFFVFLYRTKDQQSAPVTVTSPPAWLQLPADSSPNPDMTVSTQIAKGISTSKPVSAKAVASEIYNGTPCPISVRINQVKSCPNVKPEPISSSSTLQPEGSAQITYENQETVAAECSVTVKEIEIKSIATGDVILLNASSTPASVQEAFRIMTREREGKILAGAFDHDCRKREKKLSLELDNSRGRITLE